MPQREDAFWQPLRAIAWRQAPSTYVICGLQSSHSLFRSRPDDVCATIRHVLTDTAFP